MNYFFLSEVLSSELNSNKAIRYRFFIEYVYPVQLLVFLHHFADAQCLFNLETSCIYIFKQIPSLCIYHILVECSRICVSKCM